MQTQLNLRQKLDIALTLQEAETGKRKPSYREIARRMGVQAQSLQRSIDKEAMTYKNLVKLMDACGLSIEFEKK